MGEQIWRRDFSKMEKVQDQKENVAKALNICLAVSGLLVTAAGVMGTYWGVKVVAKVGAWPLMNLNGVISGIFMLIFGAALIGLTFFGRTEVCTWAKFLDTFWGRGAFCIYLGIRIMPMGQYFCLIGGVVMLFFGIAQVIAQFVFFEKPGYSLSALDKEHNDELVSSVIEAGGLYKSIPATGSA